MLSNPQKALLAMAKRQVGFTDDDYRQALQEVTGVRSSTDARLGDRHFDRIMGYFEAVYWLKVDKAELLHDPSKGNAPFLTRRFWASRNTAEETSRDRFALNRLNLEIAQLERAFGDLGYGPEYVAKIKENVSRDRSGDDLRSLHAYAAALRRTLAGKKKHMEAAHA